MENKWKVLLSDTSFYAVSLLPDLKTVDTWPSSIGLARLDEGKREF